MAEEEGLEAGNGAAMVEVPLEEEDEDDFAETEPEPPVKAPPPKVPKPRVAKVEPVAKAPAVATEHEVFVEQKRTDAVLRDAACKAICAIKHGLRQPGVQEDGRPFKPANWDKVFKPLLGPYVKFLVSRPDQFAVAKGDGPGLFTVENVTRNKTVVAPSFDKGKGKGFGKFDGKGKGKGKDNGKGKGKDKGFGLVQPGQAVLAGGKAKGLAKGKVNGQVAGKAAGKVGRAGVTAPAYGRSGAALATPRWQEPAPGGEEDDEDDVGVVRAAGDDEYEAPAGPTEEAPVEDADEEEEEAAAAEDEAADGVEQELEEEEAPQVPSRPAVAVKAKAAAAAADSDALLFPATELPRHGSYIRNLLGGSLLDGLGPKKRPAPVAADVAAKRTR